MFYFTSCLVLLIGLNQMAVFSSRRLHKGLQKRSTIILSSSLLFIVSLLGGMCTSEVVFLFVTMENIDTCFPTCESAEVYVDSFFSVVSAIACIFFVIAVLNLRRKRQNVVSSVTKSMLESAKMSIFRQSCFILFCSTVLVAVRILVHFAVGSRLIYSSTIFIETFINSMSQIAIPMVVVTSAEFRKCFVARILYLRKRAATLSTFITVL